MTLKNCYVTQTQFLAYLANSANATMGNVHIAINAASRAFDREAGRYFYPMIKTNYYDTPKKSHIRLHDDLLEVLTLTNGDGSTIAAADYKLWPYNATPYSLLKLNPASTIYFEESTSNYEQAAISLNGVWGYSESYSQAWGVGSTLSAAITTTSATTCTVTAGTNFAIGQIIRIDNELLLITGIATTTLTVIRGWNGSTAATHLILATITIWEPEADAVSAVLIQATRYFKRADAVFGTIGGGDMGVQTTVIPKLDPDVQRIAESFRSQF